VRFSSGVSLNACWRYFLTTMSEYSSTVKLLGWFWFRREGEEVVSCGILMDQKKSAFGMMVCKVSCMKFIYI